MRVYVAGGSEEEIAMMKQICLENGWELKVVDRIGRPRADYPVQKVLDTYERVKIIRVTARMLDIPPAAVSRIVRQARTAKSLKLGI